jgi:hypothetical protein
VLINCPECQREISDKAPACPGCGYVKPLPPMAAGQRDRLGNASALPSMQPNHCPRCGSDDVTSAPMLWASGTSQIDTRTRGSAIGVAGGLPFLGGHLGVGVAASRTRGAQTTALARQYAPPALERGYGGLGLAFGIIILGFFGFFAGATLANLLPIASAFALVSLSLAGMIGLPTLLIRSAVKAGAPRAARNAERAAGWQRTWVCLRCGGAGDESEFERPESA